MRESEKKIIWSILLKLEARTFWKISGSFHIFMDIKEHLWTF